MRENPVTPMMSQPEACAMLSSSSTPGISGNPGKWPSKIVDATGTVACVLMVRSPRSRSTIRSISWKYSKRMPLDSCTLGGGERVDMRAKVLQDEILLGRRLALVDLLGPLLERHFDPEGLVDCKCDVEKVEAVDTEIIDRVAFELDRIARNIAGLGNDIGDGVEGR